MGSLWTVEKQSKYKQLVVNFLETKDGLDIIKQKVRIDQMMLKYSLKYQKPFFPFLILGDCMFCNH